MPSRADDQRRLRQTTPRRFGWLQRRSQAQCEEVWARVPALFEHAREVAAFALGKDDKVPVVDNQDRNAESRQDLFDFVTGRDDERLALLRPLAGVRQP